MLVASEEAEGAKMRILKQAYGRRRREKVQESETVPE